VCSIIFREDAMLTRITTAIVAALLALPPAFAGGNFVNTTEAFEAEYSEDLNIMTSEGVRPTTRCWPDYCATYMSSSHNGVTVFEARNVLQSGEENRQICFTADSETTRICRFSTGLTVSQTYATNQWVTTFTITSTFDAPPPPSPVAPPAPYKVPLSEQYRLPPGSAY
jgi:hypothetical protein